MLELSKIQGRWYRIPNQFSSPDYQTGTGLWAPDGLELNVIAISAKQTQRHAPGICIAMLELKNEA